MKAQFQTMRSSSDGRLFFVRLRGDDAECFGVDSHPDPMVIGRDEVPSLAMSAADVQTRLAPVPAFFGRQIFAFAKNFCPFGETPKSRDCCPLVFIKPEWTVASADTVFDLTELNRLGARVWGESELAFTVTGDLQAGWVTVANDITMHFPHLDLDNHLPYFKGQPGFLPVSSSIYPPALLDDYRIQSVSDGEIVRDGGSREQLWTPAEMMDWLNSWAVLHPGDLVLIGAPLRFEGHTYVQPGSRFDIVLNGEIVMSTHFA